MAAGTETSADKLKLKAAFTEEEFELAAKEIANPDLSDFEFFVESHGTKIYRRYIEVCNHQHRKRLCFFFSFFSYLFIYIFLYVIWWLSPIVNVPVVFGNHALEFLPPLIV